ncbi:MAG TPA: hypothetical protein VKG20_05100 [Methylomirabilota bacterium]|nr:hypothetical protein [Methylomirabilota bacterium]
MSIVGRVSFGRASDLFGGRRFGVIYGALSAGGVVYDVLGSYRVVFLTSIVFCALGSACFWLAGRRAP